MPARPDSASVLVTGGTGVVGRAIVRQLLVAGCAVRILSRSGSAAPQPGLSICRGDVTRGADLALALQGCDAVIHCAAEKRDPTAMQAVNVAATRLLLEMARDAQLRFLCYLSSVGVIGRTRDSVADEATACHPMNRYAESKFAAEGIVGQGLPGAKVVILRPTNVFDSQSLATWLRHDFRSRLRQFLIGRENTHLVYVEDVAAAAVHWSQAPARQGVDTFIVSSDEEGGGTWRELRAALASICDGAAPQARMSTRPGMSAPLWMPQLARLIRHGDRNRGDLVYSSRRLREAGFCFPYGWRNGLVEAVGQWHGQWHGQ